MNATNPPPAPTASDPVPATAAAGSRPLLGVRSSKIQPRHLERLAIVYVRQSSPQQVLQHGESKARQYALADYAVALGWPTPRVLVIDQGWLHGRQTPGQGHWVAWADDAELRRLRRLKALSRRGVAAYPPALITPKTRPKT